MGDSLKDIVAKHLKGGLKVGTASEVMTPAVPLSFNGILVLDHVSGIGGIPRGRISEFYGLPASGKTTAAMHIAAYIQSKGGKIGYFDYEAALDPVYCKAIGLDVEDSESFYLIQPDYLEQGANLAISMISTGDLDLVIFDSVASMLPLTMMDKDVGDPTVAAQAKILSEFLKKLVPLCRKTDTAAIFINHLMNTIPIPGPGGSRISRETTPGGRALKFYSSQRYRFTLDASGEKGSQYNPLTNAYEDYDAAATGKVWVEKNKVARPHLTAPYVIRYGEGFDNVASAIDILKAHGIIDVAGRFHRIPSALDDPTVFDRSNAEKYPDHPGMAGSAAGLYNGLKRASRETQERWFQVARQMLDRDPSVEEATEEEPEEGFRSQFVLEGEMTDPLHSWDVGEGPEAFIPLAESPVVPTESLEAPAEAPVPGGRIYNVLDSAETNPQPQVDLETALEIQNEG